MIKPASGKAFNVFHKIFQVGILLKGINAAVELVCGTALLAIPTPALKHWLASLLNPIRDFNANSFLVAWGEHYIGRLSDVAQDFVAWYFLSHGVIKLMVVVCLLRGWIWAYPFSLVVFAGFMGFQTWEFFTGSHSWFYIFLDVFDAFVIWLALNEWRHAQGLRKAGKAAKE
jgi:uncharacterized membrane protein